tara:strand:- start:28 stop:522 length:495 start_codon:yes stop_codon:yes gene_type:complete
MVGIAKNTSGYTNTYNVVGKEERECSSGVRRCPPSTNPSGNYSGLWIDRKEKKETYDVVLHNGQTVTKTYTPYRSKWKQRKDARLKNWEEWMDKKQTEGTEYINDNGIKLYKNDRFEHEKYEGKGSVEDEWVERFPDRGLKSGRGSYNYGYIAPIEVPKKKIKD